MAADVQKITIVYIEDNAANFDVVARVLESTGRYRVIGAPDGEEGIELVSREHPALVLVDLDLPHVNGFEVTRRLKGSPDPSVAGIPVAAVSANVMADERLSAMSAGCAAFIEKPFDINELRAEVDRLVRTGKRQ